MWKMLLLPFLIHAAGPADTLAAKKSPKVEAKAPVAASSTAQTVSRRAIVGVNGMVCSFCAQGIEKKFKAKSEVAGINVDLDNKKVTLDFKDGQQLSDEIIREIIIQEAGYQVVSITRE